MSVGGFTGNRRDVQGEISDRGKMRVTGHADAPTKNPDSRTARYNGLANAVMGNKAIRPARHRITDGEHQFALGSDDALRQAESFAGCRLPAVMRNYAMDRTIEAKPLLG
ncbi:hypothetical protein GCM10019059_41620 [Camelimonas fluminis]|nr:hypothetical protein GCM10019059_41620 [Camelimonas fluminis]